MPKLIAKNFEIARMRTNVFRSVPSSFHYLNLSCYFCVVFLRSIITLKYQSYSLLQNADHTALAPIGCVNRVMTNHCILLALFETVIGKRRFFLTQSEEVRKNSKVLMYIFVCCSGLH